MSTVLNSSFHKVCKKGRGASRKAVSGKQALRLEPLEKRELLTTYTPDVYIDMPEANDQYLTLREAVELANQHPGPDTVQLKAGAYWLTTGPTPGGKSPQYWNGGGALEINDDLVIKAPSGTSLRMEWGINGTRDRLFEIHGGNNVEIENLWIGNGGWGGQADNGGAILNAGNLTLRNSSVEHSHATGNGGGIYNTGKLELINTTVWYNSADGNGGGIFNASGSALVSGGKVQYNGAGSYYGTGGNGGGIYNSPYGTMTVSNSSVYSNHAYANWLGNRGDGGGIYNGKYWGVTVVNGGVAGNYSHKPWGTVNNFAGQPVYSYYVMSLAEPLYPTTALGSFQLRPWP
jgi:hypothetical protein